MVAIVARFSAFAAETIEMICNTTPGTIRAKYPAKITAHHSNA